MKCDPKWIADPKWQKTREDLVGKWKTQEKYCLKQLHLYLGSNPPISRLCVVANYLLGTAFRTGKIKSRHIDKFRANVLAEYKKRKLENV